MHWGVNGIFYLKTEKTCNSKSIAMILLFTNNIGIYNITMLGNHFLNIFK